METLADLSISQSPSSETISDATYEQIGALLKQQCEDTQFYLQHDLTLSHLAHAAAQSGYRSYRTFSVAFRQRKGQSVTAWMNEEESA